MRFETRNKQYSHLSKCPSSCSKVKHSEWNIVVSQTTIIPGKPYLVFVGNGVWYCFVFLPSFGSLRLDANHSFQVSNFSFQVPVSSFQFPSSSFWFSAFSVQFPTSSFQLPILSFHFPVSSVQFRVCSFHFPVPSSQFPMVVSSFQLLPKARATGWRDPKRALVAGFVCLLIKTSSKNPPGKPSQGTKSNCASVTRTNIFC